VFTKFDAQKSISFGELVESGTNLMEAMAKSTAHAQNKFVKLEQRIGELGYKYVYLEGMYFIYSIFETHTG